MKIYHSIERLIQYGLQHGLFEIEDIDFMRNSLIGFFEIDDYEVPTVEEEKLSSPVPILEELLGFALEKGLLQNDSVVYRDLMDTKIMGLLMPRPSQVIQKFYQIYENNKEEATSYLYHLSQACHYIRTDRIAQNVNWKTETEYGLIDITINLSKPEKDPKAIAAAKHLKTSNYPKCLLCKENVGYSGRVNHPARQNLRVIPFELQGQEWNIQYSPYVYYNEHCIVFSSSHEPMVINKNTFDRNLEFVEKFPHYFIGSNADLPIVGGSILTHDHYQGGRYEFAMSKAAPVIEFTLPGYDTIKASIIKWPLSVVRLSGKDRKVVSEVADKILQHWKSYSDERVGILSHSDTTPHNTITPIARKKNEDFEIDLVLRNNRTSEEHPDGIYHPHAQYHHIKKENIGLIEVLGLAVLPSRLKEELEIMKSCLLENNRDGMLKTEELAIHIDWYDELVGKYGTFDTHSIDALIEDEVGYIFAQVLEDCGVFKWNEEGKLAMSRYIESLSSSM